MIGSTSIRGERLDHQAKGSAHHGRHSGADCRLATDPAAFDAFFKSEVTRWTEVARRAGLTVQ
jgi:hypothetical protein